MSLRDAPLLYVFYETASLPRQRELCEQVFGLPVIENQFHPPHEFHGLVKYDAGGTILSLNLSKEGKFAKDASDGLITVLRVDSQEAVFERLKRAGYTPPREPGARFTDAYGHHYIFRDAGFIPPSQSRQTVPAVEEFRLTVSDFALSLAYYRDILGLQLLDRTERMARFATGTVDLVIEEGQEAPDGRPPRYSSYLIVFYVEDIFGVRDALIERGLAFKSHGVGNSDIGYSARFIDPSGQVFCLYTPSDESLTWGSGPKVRELMAGTVAAR